MMQSFPIFIINLPRDIERKKFMSEQLDKLNLSYEFITGFSGDDKNVVKSCSDELSVRHNKTALTKGEKGCAYSHRYIYQKMVKENIGYALIMEDDVELPDNFKIVLEDEIKKRKDDRTKWEYLSFNYPTVGLKFIQLWLFLFSHMFKDKKSLSFYLKLPLFFVKFVAVSLISSLERIREIVYIKRYKHGNPALFFRPLYLAGCYLLTKKGAEKLLSINYYIIYTADRLPNVAITKKGLKFYAFVPLLVKQKREVFGSSISADKSFKF